ncbi:MAG: RNA polymerase sigma-70 factor (family 1) [Bacteroidia bacterium]|jgi:RNA polymerase sigma-70 factor (ECF subfamily)
MRYNIDVLYGQGIFLSSIKYPLFAVGMARNIEMTGDQSVEELLGGLKQGDQKSFELLYHKFHKWLLAVSLAIVRSRESAEEIVEDVFFELWERRRECDQIKSIESYLYVTVKNRSLDYYRKHSKNHFVEIEELNNLDVKISPEDIYLFEELNSHLDRGVSQLPPKCAEVFRLVKLEGHSYKKAAELLKITPKTVENQLGIAVKRMALTLEPYLNENPKEERNTLKALIFLCIIFSI